MQIQLISSGMKKTVHKHKRKIIIGLFSIILILTCIWIFTADTNRENFDLPKGKIVFLIKNLFVGDRTVICVYDGNITKEKNISKDADKIDKVYGYSSLLTAVVYNKGYVGYFKLNTYKMEALKSNLKLDSLSDDWKLNNDCFMRIQYDGNKMELHRLNYDKIYSKEILADFYINLKLNKKWISLVSNQKDDLSFYAPDYNLYYFNSKIKKYTAITKKSSLKSEYYKDYGDPKLVIYSPSPISSDGKLIAYTNDYDGTRFWPKIVSIFVCIYDISQHKTKRIRVDRILNSYGSNLFVNEMQWIPNTHYLLAEACGHGTHHIYLVDVDNSRSRKLPISVKPQRWTWVP